MLGVAGESFARDYRILSIICPLDHDVRSNAIQVRFLKQLNGMQTSTKAKKR